MSTRYVNTLLIATIMVLVSMNGVLDFSEKENESPELLELDEPQFASSPGHSVFAEYVGADWCGPCMNGGSPSMHALKTSFPSEFTYLSYFESGGSYPPDPLNRRSHVMYDSSGIPTASFGDANTGTYHPVGAGSGTTAYDSQFSSGGDMKNVNDYSISLTQTVNGANMDIDVTATYLGSSSSVTVYVLSAITEATCPDTYNDGSHPHNVIKKWLLNSGNNGFRSLQLTPNTPVTTSWQEPISTVRSYGSSTAAQNFNTVAALTGGAHSTYADVFVATDATMNPMDLSVIDLTITNVDSNFDGFLAGETLSLEGTVKNTGTEDYSDGGSIQLYHVDGATETTIGQATSLNNLNVGQTQTVNAQFDTTGLTMAANGLESFRVRLTNTAGENDPVANNRFDSWISHDYTPSTDTPLADGNTAIPRGGTLDFDVTGNARDNVDTLATMTPELEVSPSGQNIWASTWVTDPASLTSAGTPYERYVFTVNPIQTAGSGDYDVRARLTDNRGQTSEWSSMSGAFSLMNGIPVVVDPNQPENAPVDCPPFPGLPTVKVETNERVSLAGLVCDAETELTNLVISSQDPSFIAWHASAGEIEVNFDTMQWDSMGNPQPQGLGISISDGEDTNTGTLLFSVIENGQPRWSSVPAQSYDEGGSSQLSLAQYLTDTDSNGNPTSVMDLTLAIVSVEPANILTAEIYGNTLMASAVDDDAFGSVVITVRATDLDGQLSETPIHVHVQNVNDAPRFDATGLENIMVQVDHTLELDLSSRLIDIDDDDAEIWASVPTDPNFQYNPISGMLTMNFNTAGQYNILLSAEDSHGDSSDSLLLITVVDNIPLVWSTDGSNGDIDIAVTDMYFGKDPTFFIVQLSDVELTNIVAEWQICTTDTGICHSFGLESIDASTFQTGHTFAAASISENGLANFDEVKLHVTAEGTDGFDYESDTISYLAIQEPGTEEPTDGSDGETDNEQTGDSEETSQAGGISIMVIGGIIGLIVLLVIAGVLGAMLLRGGRDEQLPATDWGTETAFATPAAAAPPVAAVAAAPVANSVPDYTHLTPGGQYVTGHAGETVYLAPNGTAWTMQADSSFIRTS